MKYVEDTMVPRKKRLNEALVELGHKIHVDKRKKERNITKERKQRKEEIEDRNYEE